MEERRENVENRFPTADVHLPPSCDSWRERKKEQYKNFPYIHTTFLKIRDCIVKIHHELHYNRWRPKHVSRSCTLQRGICTEILHLLDWSQPRAVHVDASFQRPSHLGRREGLATQDGNQCPSMPYWGRKSQREKGH
jgi:hypothetical protein